MARYIDADKVMEEIKRIGGHNLCELDTIGVKALIDRQPTADVVPKSEVDKTIAEFAYLHAEALNKFENARAEVAREIFAEIETALKPYKQHDLRSGTYFECYLESDIAELKKKYTGEQT